MNSKKVKEYEMLTRVVDFGTKHVGLFPEFTAAREVITSLGSAVSRLSQQASSQVAGAAAIRTSNSARLSARQALQAQLGLMDRTARALKIETFHPPRKRSDQALLDAGRAFVAEAEPLKKELLEHGLRLEDFNAAVEELTKAIRDNETSKASRSAAIHEFRKTMEEAQGYLQRLDALVANTLQDNPAALASWEVARRVDHPGGRKKVVPAPPTQPPDPPAATASATA